MSGQGLDLSPEVKGPAGCWAGQGGAHSALHFRELHWRLLCSECGPLQLGAAPSKDVSLFLSLEPVNLTLFGKRVLADVVKLRVLR